MNGTRRDFVAAGSLGLGGAWIATQMPAVRAAAAHARLAAREGLPLAALTEEEAREIEAVAARIIPTDDTPGAREADVIRFIDRAFETFQADGLPAAREGLEDLGARAAAAGATDSRFSQLDETRQDALLREIEDGGFFGMIRFLTVMGMFANPEYGGNRDKIGWKLIGFEDRYRWLPPFGWYDAEENRG